MDPQISLAKKGKDEPRSQYAMIELTDAPGKSCKIAQDLIVGEYS
jgi:hypothetical protein